MSVEIQDIVELLRQPPFSRSEGIVDFSKKTPLELLQVVSDVFGHIDDRQRKDLRDENKDDMTARLLGFVTVLGYKIDDVANFGTQFMSGNTGVVYPFLRWTLENFEKLKTRGHLARYLVPLSIPEEHFADAQVVTMYQQYTMRQAEFKDVHMQLEEVRKGASNPTHLAAEVAQLEHEKEQLHTKLEKLRARISNDAEYASVNFDEMLGVTNKLRQEQEAEAKLYQDAQEQKHKLSRAEATRIATAKKFQEMNHSDMGRMEPLKLVAKLRDEVQARHAHLEEKLEVAISEREKQLKHLTKMASSGSDYSADDVHELQREKANLASDIDSLLQRRENSAAANDSKITFIRDRLAGVERKREKLVESLAELGEEAREAEAELKRVTGEFKALTGSNADAALGPGGIQRPQTDAQMKEYMNELARKTAKYKALKAELEHERSEISILQRTEEILRSRAANLESFNAEQEKRLGVVGYGAKQEELESIAAATAQVNEGKGATLEELSDVIERIKSSLLKKKEKLAPQIKDLRGVRADFEALEAVYRTKKSAYDNAQLGFESERMKLEQDVASLQQAVHDDQSHFHFLHSFALVTAARSAQANREAHYRDLYEAAILEQEAATKQLRQDKKTVSEKQEDHVKQRALFTALRGILNKKLEITRNPARGQVTSANGGGANQLSLGGSNGGQQGGYGGPKAGSGSASYLDQLAEESDRLVLEQ